MNRDHGARDVVVLTALGHHSNSDGLRSFWVLSAKGRGEGSCLLR